MVGKKPDDYGRGRKLKPHKMNEINCYTQADLDKAVAENSLPVLCGDGRFDITKAINVLVKESSAPSIVARESSAPSIVARESSAPRIEARESSAPSIVARGSSAPRIEARESSAPSIEAWGYCLLNVKGAAKIKASENVVINQFGTKAKITGGTVRFIDVSTPEKWCEFYGVHIVDGQAILYKAVRQDLKSSRGMSYEPGSSPSAPDWDGGEQECGKGLHFSPSPMMALAFDPEATRFVQTPVPLAEIAVHPDGDYPEKVKAPRCGPVKECDRFGKVIES